MAGGRWRFKAAPGVLTAIATNTAVRIDLDEVSSFLLHGPRTGARMVLSVLRCWFNRDCEDPEAELDGSVVGCQRSLAVHFAPRDACARSVPLHHACQAVFAEEGAAFREDWFGRAVL